MKIVHINTYDSGGAANAAISIHLSLLKSGYDSYFICLYDSGRSIENKIVFSKYLQKSILFKTLHKFKLYKTQAEKNKEKLNNSSGDFEQFTSFRTDYEVEKHSIVIQADIIHLHWVADFINYKSFFREVKKPIIWTFHDKNPVLGGFHLRIDLDRNNNLLELENEYQIEKNKILSNVKSLKIVSPSQALMHYSQNKLPTIQHQHVFNTINFDVFQSYDHQAAKELLGFSKSTPLILSLVFPKSVYHKGTDLLINAIELQDSSEVNYVLIGQTDLEIPKDKVTIVKKITDSRLLSIWYSAADAFVISSREENLPNTMLEAMACGTPVIAFPLGGMAEVIKNNFNGMLAKEVSAGEMVAAINLFIENIARFDRKKIREFALQNFAPSIIIKKYTKLYESVL